MFTTFVRPKAEYASEVWNPYLIKDITIIEKIQRRFTKRLPGLGNVSYDERLSILELPSLEKRRKIRDLIMTFKIVNGLVAVDVNDFFTFNVSNTRGHEFKFKKKQCSFGTEKELFQ